MEEDIIDDDGEESFIDDLTIDLVSDSSLQEEELSEGDNDSLCHVPNIIEDMEYNDN